MFIGDLEAEIHFLKELKIELVCSPVHFPPLAFIAIALTNGKTGPSDFLTYLSTSRQPIEIK